LSALHRLRDSRRSHQAVAGKNRQPFAIARSAAHQQRGGCNYYVLWESGKPTHVFDLDLLEGRRLIIRKARAGETLKTLDGVERKLSTEDLVVADAKSRSASPA